MDYKAIINIMKEMNQTDLTKLEIEEEGFRICMEKGRSIQGTEMQNPPKLNANPAQTVNTVTVSQPSIDVFPSSNQPITINLPDGGSVTNQAGKKITSPMVGTFYAQPAPDKAPYVKVGDKVKKGQVVCIIEAMKLMNEIESDVEGEIVEILVKNEEMVEYGQPLFLLK